MLSSVAAGPAGARPSGGRWIAGEPASIDFFVRRAASGQPTHLPLTVLDDCGPWRTFVGGGPNAF